MVRERIDSIRYLLREYRAGISETEDMIYGLSRMCEELVEIVQVQEEQIDTLIEQVVSLQASGGNTAARVSHLERVVNNSIFL